MPIPVELITVCRFVKSLFKRTLLLVLLVEFSSFAVVTFSNFAIYGSAFEGSRMQYDAHALFLSKEGVRPTSYTAISKDPTHQRTIWLFGGSTMRGCTDDDKQTIPSILARIIGERNDTLRFNVRNFGVNSFNILMETKYLQKLLIEEQIKPDLIVFYDGGNDSTYFAQYRSVYGHYGYRRVSALVECYRNRFMGILKPLNAAIYASFTRELYEKVTGIAVPLEENDPLLADFESITEQRYDHVNRMAEAYGASFLAIWQPLAWVESDKIDENVRREEEKTLLRPDRFRTFRSNIRLTYNKVSQRLAGKPYFVDFRNILCSRQHMTYKADGVHLLDSGREAVAARMAQLLQERYAF